MNNLNARTRLRAVPCCPPSPTGIRPEMARSIALSIVDRLCAEMPLVEITEDDGIAAGWNRGFRDIQDLAAISTAVDTIVAERIAALPAEPPPTPKPATKARRQPRARRKPVQLAFDFDGNTEARG